MNLSKLHRLLTPNPTVEGFLHCVIYPEDHEPDTAEELEIEAEVTFEYECEPYEAPSRYSPGGGGFLNAWINKVHSITFNGEELEGWEFDAATVALEQWAEDNIGHVDDACEQVLLDNLD